MEKTITLNAARRDLAGKKVRQLRQEGWVPGVLYGTGKAAQSLQVTGKELVEAYRQAGSTALISLVLEGEKKTLPAIIRSIQRHPISMEIIHVDVQLVDLRQPVTTHVAIVFHGESSVSQQGEAVLTHGLEQVEVRGLPSDIPAHLEVDLSTITRLDQSIQVRDLTPPPGIQFLTDPETVLVHVVAIRKAEEVEAEPAVQAEAQPEVEESTADA